VKRTIAVVLMAIAAGAVALAVRRNTELPAEHWTPVAPS
jgi:hypothetical protein